MSKASPEVAYQHQPTPGRPLRWKHSDPSTSGQRTETSMGGPATYPAHPQQHPQGAYRIPENPHGTRAPVIPTSVAAAYANQPSRRNSESQPTAPSPGQTHFTYDVRSLESNGRIPPPPPSGRTQSDLSAGQSRFHQHQPQPPPQSVQRPYQQPVRQPSDAEPSSSRRSSSHSQPQLTSTSTTQNVGINTPSAPEHSASSPTTSVAPTSSSNMPPSHPGPPPRPQSQPQHPQAPPPQSQPSPQPHIHPIVAKNAAKALAPIRHLYEQAWTQTVTNVQQEMSRMHTELLAILEAEHKQHRTTRDIFSHLKHDHEGALGELERLRTENGDLKTANEEMKKVVQRSQADVAGLRAEVERYALTCQKLRAENQVLDGNLREAHACVQEQRHQHHEQREQGGGDREEASNQRAAKEYMDDQLERMKHDFAKQMEAQMEVVLKEVHDQKAAREDAERMLKEMRDSPFQPLVPLKPESIRRSSEAGTLVGTPESESMAILKPLKQENDDVDTSLDFPIKYTLSPTSIDCQPSDPHASTSARGSANIIVSRPCSPSALDRPRAERPGSPMRIPHGPGADPPPPARRSSPLPTPRPSPLLGTSSSSSLAGPKRSSRENTEVIDLTSTQAPIHRSTSGTGIHKPPLAISIPHHDRSEAKRSRPSSPQSQQAFSVPPSKRKNYSPSSPHLASGAKRSRPASPESHPPPTSNPASTSAQPTTSSRHSTPRLASNHTPNIPPQSHSRPPHDRSYSAPTLKDHPHPRITDSPPMASLAPNGNERSTIRHPWYSSSNPHRDPDRHPLPASARSLKRDRSEYEDPNSAASATTASASASATPRYSWQQPPPSSSSPLMSSAERSATDTEGGERPRARAKTDEGSRDAKPSPRSGEGGRTSPAVSTTGFGRWKAMPPPNSASSSSGAITPSRSNKIGINHMDLLYETKGDKMVCRMCRTPNLKDQPQPKQPASFPLKAGWAELVGHCQKAHPKSFEDLEKLSPAQVAELRQRMTSSKISGFILG